MDIPNPKKVEIRGKKVVKTGARLAIRKGVTEEEWEIPLSNPEVKEIYHRKWIHRRARAPKS